MNFILHLIFIPLTRVESNGIMELKNAGRKFNFPLPSGRAVERFLFMINLLAEWFLITNKS